MQLRGSGPTVTTESKALAHASHASLACTLAGKRRAAIYSLSCQRIQLKRYRPCIGLRVSAENILRVCRSVRDAEGKFADDAQWVPQTQAYQRIQGELARVRGELVQAHTEKTALEGALRREQEGLRVRTTEFNQLHRTAAMHEVRHRARPRTPGQWYRGGPCMCCWGTELR